jgi:CheY-like chemotaxis protein
MEKMESVGRLAGGVAHDFNNMLNVILGHTEMALEKLEARNPLRTDLEEVRNAGERSANLTKQLLAFARKQTIAPRIIDLNEAISSTLKMLERLIGESIELHWKPGKDLPPVNIDPGQVDQMLTNLAINASDAIGRGHGRISIETSAESFSDEYCADNPGCSPGSYLMLSVSDDGCGMDRETRSHIFEPFYTTKDSEQGTGLGLATVYGIVIQNGGFINVTSEKGQGTTFNICLPVSPQEKPSSPKTTSHERTARGSETILVVEDEPSILKMVTMMLKMEGYTVIPAGSPGEAIRLAREHCGDIHLLVSDVVMPEMNGRDLARNIISLYPNVKRLFMSGYTADVIAHQGVLDQGVNFLQKPFSKMELTSSIRRVLDGK